RGLMPLADGLVGNAGAGASLPERLNTALAAGAPYFAEARKHAFAASDKRNLIERDQLDGPLAPADGALDRLDPKWPALLSTVQTLADLPVAYSASMGFDRPKTYLILGQSNDEIRATGGFIGSMGLLTVSHGKIEQLDYKSSYDWDRPG